MHELPSNLNNVLTAIIPVTQMAGRLENLKLCFSDCRNLPISLILIHDIQDEKTSSELRELLLAHNNLEVVLIEGVYGSPGMARNAGLETSQAPWTIFWDADDLPRPQTVVDAISQADGMTDLIIGNFSTNSPIGNDTVMHLGKLENVALNPGLWRVIIHSEIIAQTRFCSTRMGEDQLFLLDLNPQSRSIHFSDEIFYEYFMGNPLQLTSDQKSIDQVADTFALAKSRIRRNSNLKSNFSSFILLKLLMTSISRTKSGKKLQFLIRHFSIILETNPLTLMKFALKLGRRKVLQK